MTGDLNRWATWRELQSQPDIWRHWGAVFDVASVRRWIDQQDFDQVWFSGAGTSAYIGDIIAAAIPDLRSVPTTDIVARPRHILAGRKPLVVSFGRSGNSAESVGTLDVLDALAPDAPRLHITCNKDGALATRAATGPVRVIVLPEVTHDAGFAMTSSFSTMLLTALALFDAPCDLSTRLASMADQMAALMPLFVAQPRPKRVVFTGTGPLAYAARESALKVMELSAGQIPALWESTLGFRHGPKSFVTDDALVTLLTSPDDPARRYEADLTEELKTQFPLTRIETVGSGGDIDIEMPFGSAWAAPLCVAAAQVRGVLWSDALGLNVDDPFAGQDTLSRVVSDVTLYPVAS